MNYNLEKVLEIMNENKWMHNDLKIENLVKFVYPDRDPEYLVADLGTATHEKGECEDNCDELYFAEIEKCDADFAECDKQNKACLKECLPSHEKTTKENFILENPNKRQRVGGSPRMFLGVLIGLGVTAACAIIGPVGA